MRDVSQGQMEQRNVRRKERSTPDKQQRSRGLFRSLSNLSVSEEEEEEQERLPHMDLNRAG